MRRSVFTIHQAKTHLSRLIARAAEGEEIVIARGSKPMARLAPIGEVAGRRRPGSMKGVLKAGPEFFDPLPADELVRWE